jgi:hypothetical protein
MSSLIICLIFILFSKLVFATSKQAMSDAYIQKAAQCVENFNENMMLQTGWSRNGNYVMQIHFSLAKVTTRAELE